MKIGVDWGGTKLEAIAIDENGSEVNRIRVDSPKDNYQEIIKTVGATSMKDMGKVMGVLKSKHGDTLDFSKVSSIIKGLLK